jgi:ribonuclease HI
VVKALAHVDGGARPTNPGHAGFGVVIYLFPGGVMHLCSRYLGWRTNNVAEYFALITAVKYAKALGAQELEVKSDSRLVVEQVHRRWRVRSDDLSLLNREARDLLEQLFPSAWSLDWVRREQNVEADQICTDAIKAGMYRNPWVRRHLKHPDPGNIIDPFSP